MRLSISELCASAAINRVPTRTGAGSENSIIRPNGLVARRSVIAAPLPTPPRSCPCPFALYRLPFLHQPQHTHTHTHKDAEGVRAGQTNGMKLNEDGQMQLRQHPPRASAPQAMLVTTTGFSCQHTHRHALTPAPAPAEAAAAAAAQTGQADRCELAKFAPIIIDHTSVAMLTRGLYSSSLIDLQAIHRPLTGSL
ncbi:unnamed protein product [Protopolystoma xenopodis]|uniref:Uncharacterized protein n=1 Tax=Protopolystoma xenopodis TaxID=117903 RepID=A0A3S5AQT7_9PLAT|nr:unnamed protein product [Protopolystoma xenopodis]